MKSSLKNMVVVMSSVTLAAAAAIAITYNMTKGPIEELNKSNMLGALSKVLHEGNIDSTQEVVLEDITVRVFTAKDGGEIVGYAVETSTMRGFGGEIKMMVGFSAAGEITGIEVVSHSETPGWGDVIADPDNALAVSFQGRNPADLRMSITRDGGDIDAITAATITSRAYVEAIDRAFRAMMFIKSGGRTGYE